MLYKAKPGVIMASVCGRYWLVTPKKRTELNDTAAFYWKELEKGITFSGLKEKVMKEYEIEDEHQLDIEIYALINELQKNHLIIQTEEQ